MTPKTIVRNLFETTITPRLARLGFAYVPTRFAFRRQSAGFQQQITITLSHRNTRESIRFWSAFNVASRRYDEWLRAQGRPPHQGFLGGCMDWNIPGWCPPDDPETSFDCSSPARREAVLDDWFRRCVSVGLPYLDELSSWDGLAADLVRGRWHWDRAADFYLIAGRPRQAVETLVRGIEELQSRDYDCPEHAAPALVQKRRRQALERDRAIAGFRARMASLAAGGLSTAGDEFHTSLEEADR